MMRNLILICSVVIVLSLKAQEDYLSILKTNASLKTQTEKYRNTTKKEFIENNVIITSDSISLPFVDDFSSNTLKPYDFSVVINDTIQYATGTCINADFTTVSMGFQTSPSYYYFYDTANNRIDSTVLNSINVYNFSEVNCFPNETSITAFWPSYYRSVDTNFNTTTGAKLDSFLVSPDTTMNIASIYFATMPKNVNWLDNYAWWNTTNPIEPISIGVATLDGLNEFGMPYNNTVINAYGKADYLTSKPIDLSLLGIGDDVYLSFFYQAAGLGDAPNPEDSLVVDFKGLNGEWTRKWSTAGIPSSDFKQVYIPIYETSFDSLIYSNSDFQFRIRNYASLSGNNDLWNIDYVRLDKNRTPNSIDTVIRDVAMLYDFPNYLKTFSMLPWDQMQAGTDNFIDTIKIPIRDNGQVEGLSAGNFPLEVIISNSVNGNIIFNDVNSNFNAALSLGEIHTHDILPIDSFTLPTISNSDSVLFYSKMNINPPVNRNLLKTNDTIKSTLVFDNVIAYDDGSAERAYGINGGGTEVKKFAYEFKIKKQDTLAAIQIHFSNIDENVSNLVFSLYAWDSIGISSNYENIIGSIENKKPVYVDPKNAYATFVFDTPIIVNNKFYIGWSQIDNRNIQMGYDLNSTKGKEHIFIFTANSWSPSSINLEGSPMMRAILDGDYPIPANTTAINDISTKEYISVYPNPTNTILNINVPTSIKNYHISVFDFTGKQVSYSKNVKQIDVSRFTQGVYFIVINDKNSNKRYSTKFIVK